MRKRRTAAQKAATRKLVALNKRRASGGTKKPIRRKRRRNPTALATKARPYRRIRKLNPVKRKRISRRRRNPVGGNIIKNVVMPSLTGASGALVLDAIWANLPIPTQLQQPGIKIGAKAIGAVALSTLLGSRALRKVIKKSTAESMGVGMLTVIAHQALREAAQRFAPQVKLDGVGYYNAAVPVGNTDMGVYANGGNSMGVYTNGLSAADNGFDNEDNYTY